MRTRVLTVLVILAAALPARAQVPGPGETSGADLAPLRVTAYDQAAGELSLSYQSGCDATDNNVYFGLLGGVASYAFSDEVCSISSTGTFTGFNPGSESYFFVIAGNDGAIEGSYGTGDAGERPAFVANSCGETQSVDETCAEISAEGICASSLDCGFRQMCIQDAGLGIAECACQPPFAGEFCQVCAPGYAGPSCRQCDDGFYDASTGSANDDETSRFNPELFQCRPDLPGSCAGMSCSGNGTCAVDGREAACVCDEGYTGADCSRCAPDFMADALNDCVLGQSCRDDKCGGHGDCETAPFGEIACVCDAGFRGVDCGGPDLEIGTSAETLTLYRGESIVLEPLGGIGPYTWRIVSGPATLQDCMPAAPDCPFGGTELTVPTGGDPILDLELIHVELIDGVGIETAVNLAALPSTVVPFTGKIHTELVPFYRAMLKYMRARGIRAGSLAISKAGKIIGSNGYGYRDAGLDADPFVNAGEGGPLTQPTSPFRLASVTKTMTAAAVRGAAMDAGVNITGADPFNGAANWVQNATGTSLTGGLAPFNYNVANGAPDPRWANVTIQHLMNHHAGFYRDVVPAALGGRPAFNGGLLPNTGTMPNQLQSAAWGASSSDLTYDTTYILAALQLTADPRPTPAQVIRFVKGTQLNYNPGGAVDNNFDNYSNLGYILLGRVLEGLRGEVYDPDEPGQPSGWGAYPELVQDYLCEASGITGGVFAGNAFNPWPGEPYYRDIDWQGNETMAWNLAEGADKIRFNNGSQNWEFCQSNCGGAGIWNTDLNTPRAYGGIWLAERNSAGGMVATAPALLRFARNHRIRVGSPGQTTTGIGTLLQSPGNHGARTAHNGSLDGTRTEFYQMSGTRTNNVPFDAQSWDDDPTGPVNMDLQNQVIISEVTLGSSCTLPGDISVAALFNQRQDRRAPRSNVSSQSGQVSASTLYGRIRDYLTDAACQVDAQGWPDLSEGGAVIQQPVICP